MTQITIQDRVREIDKQFKKNHPIQHYFQESLVYIVILIMFIVFFFGVFFVSKSFAGMASTTGGNFTCSLNGASKMLCTSHFTATNTPNTYYTFQCGTDYSKSIQSILLNSTSTNVLTSYISGGLYRTATSTATWVNNASDIYFMNVTGALTDWNQVQDCGSTVNFTFWYMIDDTSTSTTSTSTIATTTLETINTTLNTWFIIICIMGFGSIAIIGFYYILK